MYLFSKQVFPTAKLSAQLPKTRTRISDQGKLHIHIIRHVISLSSGNTKSVHTMR